MRHFHILKAAAALFAFAVATVGLVGAAQADDDTTPSVITGYSSTFPTFEHPMTATQLTIQLPADNPFNDATAAPLGGYTLTASRVNGVDVTTKDGYQAAAHFTENQAREKGLTRVDVQVSNGSGLVLFPSLDPGLYLIDTEAPKGVTVTKEIASLLVILPATDKNGDWLTQVTIEAKVAGIHTPTPPATNTPTPSQSETAPPTIPLTGASTAGILMAAALLVLWGFALMRRTFSRLQYAHNEDTASPQK